MTEQIKPGQWVRWLATDNPDAPLAQWRLLVDIVEGWPRWSPTLVFADGYSVPQHIANLTVTDDSGRPLWEVSDTKPEEVTS
jgi:hypothetical protein